MVASAETLFSLVERHEWRAVFTHLQSRPTDASVTKDYESVKLLPLHKAIAERAPLSVIRSFLAANPSAIKVKGEHGYLPLHYACRWSHPQEKVISLLLSSDMTAASTPADNGMLPLHMVCQSVASEEVIDVILAAHPEGMNVQDKSYHYPLYYVKSSSSNKKMSMFKALDHAAVYCNISKTASARTVEVYETKLRKLNSEHATKMEKLIKQLSDEKAKSQTLEGILNSSDVNEERKKVESLTAKMEKMKTSFDAERAESKQKMEELQSNLDEARAQATNLCSSLEESNHKVASLVDSEASLTEEVAALKGKLECSMFQLREMTGARDSANDYVHLLESRLSEATTENRAHVTQNRMLKDMLRSLSANVQHVMKEHEAAKETMEARVADLQSVVASSSILLDRAHAQSDTLIHTKIDIDNMASLVADDSTEESSDEN